MAPAGRIWFAVGLCTMLAAGLVIAGCGSSDSSSASNNEGGSSSVSSSDLAKYEGELESAIKGTYTLPEGQTVKAPSGKDIWVIELSKSVEAVEQISAAMDSAAPELGWTVHYFDGRFEPSRWQTGIEQAIAAGADGIALLYFDCATVKSGLEQAKKAGIPVVGLESKDCNPSLESEFRWANGKDFIEHNENGFGAYQGIWTVAKTKGEAKVVVSEETDIETTKAIARGAKKKIEECSTCEIVDEIKFVGTELGPATQQKIEQALNEHPEANAFVANYDSLLTTGGGAAALRASGRLGEITVVAGEGTAPGNELIYNESGNDACIGTDNEMAGYAVLLTMSRLFAGQDPYQGNTGMGNQICDKEHNLPPKGEAFKAPVNYVPAYEKLWGLK